MRRIVAQHPENEFIFLFDRPFDPQFIYGKNVTPVVLSPRARFAPQFYAWFEWAVPRALKKHGADVFFSPDAMCSLSAKTPTVMTCHDLVPLHHPAQIPLIHRHYLLYFLPKHLRRADCILTVSNYVRQDISQTCGIPPEKIITVHNGCREGFLPVQDSEKQQVRREFASGQAYFLYTGAIHPRKNIARLIRAFDLFKSRTASPVKLLLVGRFAWKTDEVKSTFEQARNRADIHFLGHLPDGDLPRVMASALAFTYVSTSEGFGLPLLEAMHAEVPVLTANATSLPEVAGDAALLVDPLSETAIAAALEKLWADDILRQNLIEKGRIQREKFSWDKAAEQVYQILKTTAAK